MVLGDELLHQHRYRQPLFEHGILGETIRQHQARAAFATPALADRLDDALSVRLHERADVAGARGDQRGRDVQSKGRGGARLPEPVDLLEAGQRRASGEFSAACTSPT